MNVCTDLRVVLILFALCSFGACTEEKQTYTFSNDQIVLPEQFSIGGGED